MKITLILMSATKCVGHPKKCDTTQHHSFSYTHFDIGRDFSSFTIMCRCVCANVRFVLYLLTVFFSSFFSSGEKYQKMQDKHVPFQNTYLTRTKRWKLKLKQTSTPSNDNNNLFISVGSCKMRLQLQFALCNMQSFHVCVCVHFASSSCDNEI